MKRFDPITGPLRGPHRLTEDPTKFFPHTSIPKRGPPFRPESQRSIIKAEIVRLVESGLTNLEVLEILFESFPHVPAPTLRTYFHTFNPRRKKRPLPPPKIPGDTIVG